VGGVDIVVIALIHYKGAEGRNGREEKRREGGKN
jgi:hypothetical protein